MDAFNDEFTFNDHALGLAFTDKTRLTEFFQKSRELFPDTVVTVTSTFESGNHTIAEWKLAATETVPYGSGSMYFRRPFSLIGVSVVQIEIWIQVVESITWSMPAAAFSGVALGAVSTP